VIGGSLDITHGARDMPGGVGADHGRLGQVICPPFTHRVHGGLAVRFWHCVVS
jgi:hypothetical protein